jgi:hypothetical protein
MSINENLNLEFAGLSTTVSALPSVTLEYLVTLGFSTALKNVHAGVRAGVLGNTKNPEDAWTDEEIAAEATKAGLAEWSRDDATVNALIAFYQRQKLADLMAGELTARRGGGAPRMSPDEKLRREIAIEFLVSAAKEKGKELPKRSDTKNGGKEAFEELLAKALANTTWAAKVEKEFKARKKSAANVSEGLEDIF